MLLLTSILIILSCSTSFGDENIPEVTITQGRLRGLILKTRKGRDFNSFTGIPFAKPPIGNFRFQAPTAADSWIGTLDATKSHSVCPQPNLSDGTVMGDEDCLYLNIYTPKLPDANNSLLPVIFFLHGGGFNSGSASPDWYGPEIILDKDVILVAPNYRLGALGFLTTGDEVVPGNNGLKDQNFALRWTKSNIAAFGGNPDKITIIGHSAGAACAHLQVLSPLSRDLISGAIAQSGTAFAAWALVQENDDAAKNLRQLSELLNCPTDSNDSMIECLKRADYQKLVKQPVKFLPVLEPNIEGAFLTESPIAIVKAGKAAKVPFITGITTSDGAIQSIGFYRNPKVIEELDKDFNRFLPNILKYGKWLGNKEEISKHLRKFYFGDKKIDNNAKEELTRLFTDVIFLIGADETIEIHSHYSQQPVYYYLFGYRGSDSYNKIFGDPTFDYGVCHADELLHLFTLGFEFPDFVPNETDKKMSEFLTTIWANFAATGNPTPEINDVIPAKWEPATSENKEYYFIENPTKISMARGLFKKRAEFIKSLNLYKRPECSKTEL